MDNQLLDYVVIALYFVVMIGAGYWGLGRAHDADDYLVAGRPEERLRAWERRLEGADTLP